MNDDASSSELQQLHQQWESADTLKLGWQPSATEDDVRIAASDDTVVLSRAKWRHTVRACVRALAVTRPFARSTLRSSVGWVQTRRQQRRRQQWQRRETQSIPATASCCRGLVARGCPAPLIQRLSPYSPRAQQAVDETVEPRSFSRSGRSGRSSCSRSSHGGSRPAYKRPNRAPAPLPCTPCRPRDLLAGRYRLDLSHPDHRPDLHGFGRSSLPEMLCDVARASEAASGPIDDRWLRLGKDDHGREEIPTFRRAATFAHKTLRRYA